MLAWCTKAGQQKKNDFSVTSFKKYCVLEAENFETEVADIVKYMVGPLSLVMAKCNAVQVLKDLWFVAFSLLILFVIFLLEGSLEW